MSSIIKAAIILSLCLISSLAYANQRLCFSFHGVEGALLKNIQAVLKLDKDFCLHNLSKKERYQHYRQSLGNIKKAIAPFGYFKPVIDSHLSFLPSAWLVNVVIQLGPPLLIRTIAIHIAGPGRENEKINAFLHTFPIKPGDIFQANTYNKAKRDLFIVTRNQGYIRAYYQNKIIINLKKYTCDIQFFLTTGQRYYFGPVTFDNHIYADDFLRRFINFHSNEPFSSQKLIQLQQAMEQSYYFRQVIVTPDFNRIQDYHVPIHFSFTVPKAKKYSLGVGYGTLTGLRLSGGISLRRVTNTGHHVEAEMKISSVLTGVTANYYIPGRQPLTDEWLLGANFKKFLPKAGKSESGTLTAGYSTKKENARFNFNLNYLLERFVIYPFSARKSHELYPSFHLTYIKVDNIANPRNGFSVLLNTRASPGFLSTNRFFQSEISTKFFLSPFSFSKFILRGNLGFTAVNQLISFPLSLRFFAGGINSIRGFADSSIGPGRYLAIASAEYQQRLIKDISGAVFYDIGTAANHFHDPLSRGAGVGIVYNSVVGPARLYLARAISKRTQPYSIEFSLGPEFS